jgi:hypothetical protein
MEFFSITNCHFWIREMGWAMALFDWAHKYVPTFFFLKRVCQQFSMLWLSCSSTFWISDALLRFPILPPRYLSSELKRCQSWKKIVRYLECESYKIRGRRKGKFKNIKFYKVRYLSSELSLLDFFLKLHLSEKNNPKLH